LLINLQPYAKPMQVEVLLGDERRALGTAQDSVEKREEMRGALRRVAETVADGLFALRDQAKWRFEMEFTSEPDWREFIEKPTFGGVQADLRPIADALARPDGSVILTEDNLGEIYERLGAAGLRVGSPVERTGVQRPEVSRGA
jgi:hypothetical protein